MSAKRKGTDRKEDHVCQPASRKESPSPLVAAPVFVCMKCPHKNAELPALGTGTREPRALRRGGGSDVSPGSGSHFHTCPEALPPRAVGGLCEEQGLGKPCLKGNVWQQDVPRWAPEALAKPLRAQQRAGNWRPAVNPHPAAGELLGHTGSVPVSS